MDDYYFNSDFQFLSCYYPNQTQSYFLPFLYCSFTLSIFVSTMIFGEEGTECFLHLEVYVMLLLGVISAIAARSVRRASQQCLICTDRGVYVLNDGQFTIDFIEWGPSLYVYNIPHYRGHPCYVFSKRELSEWMVKDYVKRHYWKTSLHVGGVIAVLDISTSGAKHFFEDIHKYTTVKSYQGFIM